MKYLIYIALFFISTPSFCYLGDTPMDEGRIIYGKVQQSMGVVEGVIDHINKALDYYQYDSCSDLPFTGDTFDDPIVYSGDTARGFGGDGSPLEVRLQFTVSQTINSIDGNTLNRRITLYVGDTYLTESYDSFIEIHCGMNNGRVVHKLSDGEIADIDWDILDSERTYVSLKVGADSSNSYNSFLIRYWQLSSEKFLMYANVTNNVGSLDHLASSEITGDTARDYNFQNSTIKVGYLNDTLIASDRFSDNTKSYYATDNVFDPTQVILDDISTWSDGDGYDIFEDKRD